MKFLLRATAALMLGACLLVPALSPAYAQGKTTLTTEREKVSYMVGLDVGKSLVVIGPDMDLAAFQRAVDTAFKGGEPLIAEDRIQPLAQALMERAAARQGKLPADGKLPEVDKQQVGYLVGVDIGNKLSPIKDELDLPMLVEGVRARLTDGKPLMTPSEADVLRSAFTERMQAKLQADQARFQARQSELGEKNRIEGAAFLAKNKQVKGVFTTGSGLQYMVLRQGAGPKPSRSGQVRVNYAGKLLDGTVFDSSYERGQPARFGLDQVIPGWTEGLSMMPVGAKYRFWIPGDLAYGASGTPGGPVGPNATLVFDVELLGIE